MDHLDRFAQEARARIARGYYRAVNADAPKERRSFVEAVRAARARGEVAVVAELKPASPAAGDLLRGRDPDALLRAYREGGAVGLSILTVPEGFNGSLELLARAARMGDRPVLMKDFLLSEEQLEAAARLGADAVLLIFTLFARGHPALDLEAMIARAHALGLEVLLEVASREELQAALQTDADMIGINSRDLATLSVSLERTVKLLRTVRADEKPLWALSGVFTPEDARRLREAGADAVLVGTALMRADEPAGLLRALRHA